MLQHLADGRVDLMIGRGNTGPVYPWFGKDIRQGIELAIENYHLLHRLWREDVVDWEGQFRTPLQGSPPPRGRWTACRRSSGTARSAARRSPSRRRTTATGSSPTTSSGRRSTSSGWSTSTGERFAHYGHGTPEQAIVGLGGQVFMRRNSQDAVREFRPYFDNAPVYGHGPVAGGLHRADAAHRGQPAAGHRQDADLPRALRRLPAAAVPDGPRRPAAEDRARAARPARREVVPVLRQELDAQRPADVPDAPTHEALVAASVADAASGRRRSPDESSRARGEPP